MPLSFAAALGTTITIIGAPLTFICAAVVVLLAPLLWRA
jgi:hypothetical protein